MFTYYDGVPDLGSVGPAGGEGDGGGRGVGARAQGEAQGSSGR